MTVIHQVRAVLLSGGVHFDSKSLRAGLSGTVVLQFRTRLAVLHQSVCGRLPAGWLCLSHNHTKPIRRRPVGGYRRRDRHRLSSCNHPLWAGRVLLTTQERRMTTCCALVAEGGNAQLRPCSAQFTVNECQLTLRICLASALRTTGSARAGSVFNNTFHITVQWRRLPCCGTSATGGSGNRQTRP